MHNNLYWNTALVFTLLLVIIIIKDFLKNKTPDKSEKSYRLILYWILLHCVQDYFWGLFNCHRLTNSSLFFFTTCILHLCCLFSTFFYFHFLFALAPEKDHFLKPLHAINALVVAFDTCLIIFNIFKPLNFFSIENNNYVTGPLRTIFFYSQFAIYITLGILFFIFSLNKNGKNREKYILIGIVTCLPGVFGLFQVKEPFIPFYSLGFFLSCFIADIFIISGREELKLLHLSIYDELTTLFNRNAYENEVAKIKNRTLPHNFVYICIDLNGLKIINDNLGHHVGDESLKGVAECMKKVFSEYGKLFRIGGDEFCAILHIDSKMLLSVQERFNYQISQWKGKYANNISVSCGYVTLEEAGKKATLETITQMADKKMYQEKSAYYTRLGIDRRGQKDAHTALCALYTKILKINITNDTYQIIDMDAKEKEDISNTEKSISKWFYSFANRGLIHPDDLPAFLTITDLTYMQEYFSKNKKALTFLYKRKHDGIFKQAVIDIIPAYDYSHNDQNLFLYVKLLD